jgi:ParB family chromosome partitioning protein
VVLIDVQTLEKLDQVVELELGSLKTPLWPLRPVKESLVHELERSIKGNGLLQPIVARRTDRGYEIVFGNHRVEACKRLGMTHVRAIVREFTEEEAFLARASENLIRNSYVDPIEEAEGYKMLLRRGWTINAIGQRVGKCDSYVCERLALLERLDRRILAKLAGGKLTASHAELISRIPDAERQNEVAELVSKKRLSVRSLEGMLRRAPAPTKVSVETVSENLYVRIPEEFSKVTGMRSGDEVFLYMRGKKIILETGERHWPNRQKGAVSYLPA